MVDLDDASGFCCSARCFPTNGIELQLIERSVRGSRDALRDAHDAGHHGFCSPDFHRHELHHSPNPANGRGLLQRLSPHAAIGQTGGLFSAIHLLFLCPEFAACHPSFPGIHKTRSDNGRSCKEQRGGDILFFPPSRRQCDPKVRTQGHHPFPERACLSCAFHDTRFAGLCFFLAAFCNLAFAPAFSKMDLLDCVHGGIVGVANASYFFMGTVFGEGSFSDPKSSRGVLCDAGSFGFSGISGGPAGNVGHFRVNPQNHYRLWSFLSYSQVIGCVPDSVVYNHIQIETI